MHATAEAPAQVRVCPGAHAPRRRTATRPTAARAGARLRPLPQRWDSVAPATQAAHAGHAHAPVQVTAEAPAQARVCPGAHAPSPVQAPQAVPHWPDSVLHERVRVPQLPQASVSARRPLPFEGRIPQTSVPVLGRPLMRIPVPAAPHVKSQGADWKVPCSPPLITQAKWMWGFVEKPVFPEEPISCPATTTSSTRTAAPP